jgi:hypothetical protein
MKKVILFLSLIVLVIFISGFNEDKEFTSEETLNYHASALSYVPTEEESQEYHFQVPFIGKRFIGFREAVAFKESQGKYHAVNTLGYLGKYQFGASTLKRLNIHDIQLFLETPELQEDAFLALCSLNKWILRKDIIRSVGKQINGIKITESGILAAAHLAGAGNVQKYLRSNGQIRFNDAYGSSVQKYLKLFSGYDTSSIEANRRPVL